MSMQLPRSLCTASQLRHAWSVATVHPNAYSTASAVSLGSRPVWIRSPSIPPQQLTAPELQAQLHSVVKAAIQRAQEIVLVLSCRGNTETRLYASPVPKAPHSHRKRSVMHMFSERSPYYDYGLANHDAINQTLSHCMAQLRTFSGLLAVAQAYYAGRRRCGRHFLDCVWVL